MIGAERPRSTPRGRTVVSAFLDPEALSAHKRQNTLHTAFLFGGLGAVVAASGWMLFGFAGLAWAAVLIGVTLLMMPSVPPNILMRMYRARRVVPRPGDQLSEVLDVLVQRAGLAHRPALYVIPSLALNAFAAGKPEQAVIAITEGLLRRLSLREIAGVLAHEVSHIRNNDLWVMGVADALTRVTQALSFAAMLLALANLWYALSGEQVVSWWAVLLLYLAPTLSSLLQLALSRAREYDADLEAVQLTGDPLGLAAALRRLEHHTGRFWEDVMLPAPGRRVAYPSLLRSHPPTEDRIRRLIEVSARPTLPPLVIADRPYVSLVGFGPVGMRPRVRFPGVWF
jgi:heat shock protein HtpX